LIELIIGAAGIAVAAGMILGARKRQRSSPPPAPPASDSSASLPRPHARARDDDRAAPRR
jgi:hypothetical protein